MVRLLVTCGADADRVTPYAAPWLSVVVPVHRVADQLPACLDSILAGADDGVEVVAVDDRSPDASGALLDGYAGRDPRVRVVHLATNVGLGRARNAGFGLARGTYVWFVDGDDWLPPGTLPAVRDRLARPASALGSSGSPDVLVVDHVEVTPDGREVATGAGPLLRQVAKAGPVPVAQLPELLRLPLVTSSCTKVFRRELLERTGLRFPPGWYEDCAVTVLLLLAAERIDALDRVCYCYRQRPGEAITKSASDRHFDVFAQYARMWDWVDGAGPAYDEPRPALFRLMVDHLLVIAGNDHRLPPHRRREFFAELAAAYRHRLPDRGYPRPGGASGLKHRLVHHRAYPAYAALRLARRALTAARARPRQPVPAPELIRSG